MNAPPRPNRVPATEPPARESELRDSFVALYSKGVERLAEIQKRSIDIAMQQNQETIALWKQISEKLPWAPRLSLLEQTATALERMAETQKSAIDLMVDQTRATVDLVKERSATWKKASDAVLNFAQESFDRTVAAQKKAAEAVVSQGKATYDKAREQFDFAGSEAVVESIQRGVDKVVEAQKAVLESVAS